MHLLRDFLSRQVRPLVQAPEQGRKINFLSRKLAKNLTTAWFRMRTVAQMRGRVL